MTDLIIGRFQPLHDGHKSLIQASLDEGHNVVVGIRDTALDESNPYTYDERKDRVEAVFGDKVETICIPDPDGELTVIVGRKVGYDVRRFPDPIEEISGTNVRRQTTGDLCKFPSYCFYLGKS